MAFLLEWIKEIIVSTVWSTVIVICFIAFFLYHGDTIIEKTIELSIKVVKQTGDALLIQPLRWTWKNAIVAPVQVFKENTIGILSVTKRKPEELDPIVHFQEYTPLKQHQHQHQQQQYTQVTVAEKSQSSSPMQDSPSNPLASAPLLPSYPIQQFITAHLDALNDSRTLVFSLKNTEKEINTRLHILKSDLSSLDIHNVIKEQYDKFVRNYTEYSQLWRQATNKAQECRVDHEEYVQYLSENIEVRAHENNEQYIQRIVDRSYDKMLNKHEDIEHCFKTYEVYYRAVLKKGDAFADFGKTMKVDYDGITNAIQKGWTFGQIIKEYGLSFALFYLPGTYFEIMSVGGFGSVGSGAAGLLYKALKHAYDKQKRRPESLYQIQRIKGTINMVEHMVMIHIRYTGLHLESFSAIKSRHGNLGQSILHLRPSGITASSNASDSAASLSDFYRKYMFDIIRDLDSIRIKKKELEDYTPILRDLHDLMTKIEHLKLLQQQNLLKR